MVSYQRWTSICFEVARSKGAQFEGENPPHKATDLVSVVGSIWRKRKSELQTATVSQARSIAQSELVIR